MAGKGYQQRCSLDLSLRGKDQVRSACLCKQEHVLARFVSCLLQCAVTYRLRQSLCGGKAFDPTKSCCGGALDTVPWANYKA